VTEEFRRRVDVKAATDAARVSGLLLKTMDAPNTTKTGAGSLAPGKEQDKNKKKIKGDCG
jgi:hypothetical protein